MSVGIGPLYRAFPASLDSIQVTGAVRAHCQGWKYVLLDVKGKKDP